MIIVQGEVKLAEGELDKLGDAAKTMMTETRKEQGCILYVFSRTMEDPNVMVISERWTDQAALDQHGASPHMAEFNKAIAGTKIESVSVKSYEAENEKILMGG